MTMTRVIALTAGLSALVGTTAAAAEENAFGTPEQGAACQKELERISSWSPARASEYKLSDACQAELKRRVDVCLQDPQIQKITNDPQYAAHKDPPGYCTETVWDRMGGQQRKFAETQKQAQKAEADKAKVAAQRMPKADLHNPQIEKSIANTFHQAFPDHKIIKVILTDKSWDYEKDAFGRVTGRDINASVVNKHPDGTCEIYSELWVQQGNGKSYKGPFEERGAGSLEKVPILCENAK